MYPETAETPRVAFGLAQVIVALLPASAVGTVQALVTILKKSPFSPFLHPMVKVLLEFVTVNQSLSLVSDQELCGDPLFQSPGSKCISALGDGS